MKKDMLENSERSAGAFKPYSVATPPPPPKEGLVDAVSA